MCEIISVTKLNDDILLNCSVYDGDFINSSLLKIFDRDDNVFEPKKMYSRKINWE